MLRSLIDRRSPPIPKGPIPNSYWVITGRLLAGEYPHAPGESESGSRFSRLMAAGVNHFIDLTQPFEMPEYTRLLPRGVLHTRFAIDDIEVPGDVSHMRRIQAQIKAALALGRNVYVHCRAGIGRTGTVMGCYLVESGLSGRDALEQLNVLWRQSARSKDWPRVPQTQQQAAYVEAWEAHRIGV